MKTSSQVLQRVVEKKVSKEIKVSFDGEVKGRSKINSTIKIKCANVCCSCKITGLLPHPFPTFSFQQNEWVGDGGLDSGFCDVK